MRQAGSVAAKVVRGARRDGKAVVSRPFPRDVKALKKRIAQAKEAIMRDHALNAMDLRIAWKTVDAICTDPTNPLLGHSWLSGETISDWIGTGENGQRCNESTIWRARKRIIERGHVVRIRRGGSGVTDLYGLPPDLANSQYQDIRLTLRTRNSDLANSQDNLTQDPKNNSLGKETAEEREQKRRQMRELIERVRAGSDA